MNTAVLTQSPSAPRTRRVPETPGALRRSFAALAARLGLARSTVVDPRARHELQLEAERLRTENFRAIAVGRLV